MRKYTIINEDGTINNMYSIGVNHDEKGLSYDGLASSYDKEFDNLDKVNVENGVGNIKHAVIGDITEGYRYLKNELISKNPGCLEDYADCIQNAILQFFGNTINSKERLSYYPTDDDVRDNKKAYGKVSDLAHKNAAMSIERAMVSQNFLIEIGIHSVFKVSTVLIDGKRQTHAYNIISFEGKNYIFDTSIPTIDDGVITPIICEIPEEVYKKIINPTRSIGYSVKVNHFNPLQNRECEIIYDAGREEMYCVDDKVLAKKW